MCLRSWVDSEEEWRICFDGFDVDGDEKGGLETRVGIIGISSG